MQPPRRSASADTIQSWLVAQMAAHASMPAAEVDVRESFARYGLDSLASVTLVAELESWLDRELPATLFWDYPSIESLAHYLVAEAAIEPPSDGESEAGV
jgi:acyl carrier protein